MKRILESLYLWFDSEATDIEKAAKKNRIDLLRCLPFFLTHLGCLGIIWVGVSKAAVLICVVAYVVRVFALTAFYHRYFSHKAFKTSRVVQFIFAFLGTAAAQRGPLWWSAHHRAHHKNSDTEADMHSPHTKGFWHSHCGWFLMDQSFKTDRRFIKDLTKFPELVFLNRFDALPPIMYAFLLYWAGGMQYLVWGYFVSTVLVYHVTFSINSLAHQIGTRTFDTKDQSKNNWWLALLTFGEGWHNNHHHWPSSARQGFEKHQIDISYMILKLMEKFGLVWDLRQPMLQASLPSKA